jgi:hypothetical protein
MMMPYLHVTHVLHDILEVLLPGQPRELVGDNLLPVPGKHLGSIASVDSRLLGLIRLHEEGVIGV